MQLAFEVPEFSTSRAAATEIDADLVAIPVPQDHTAAFEWLDRSSGGELNAAIQRGEFNGKLCEIWLAPTMTAAGKTRRLAAVGVGPRGELSVERIRRVGPVARPDRLRRTGAESSPYSRTLRFGPLSPQMS